MEKLLAQFTFIGPDEISQRRRITGLPFLPVDRSQRIFPKFKLVRGKKNPL